MRKRARCLAVAGGKGGVGKTSISIHLAAGWAAQGKRVLLVDLDAQAHATAWLLGRGVSGPGTVDALMGEIPADAVREVEGRPGLAVLPATPALGTADLALASEVGGELLLRRALASLRGFELVVFDCPPNLGVVVLAGLCASHAVLAPCLPAFMSLSGLARLEDAVGRVVDRLEIRTRVLGAVLFAVDSREAISAECRDLLREELGGRLFSSEVRVSTRAKSLPANQQTAWDAGADPRGLEDYRAVLAETSKRLEA